MAVRVGPFQRIVGVNWPAAASPRPLYIVLGIHPYSGETYEEWSYVDPTITYQDLEICYINQNDLYDPLTTTYTPYKATNVEYKVKIADRDLCLAYYDGSGNGDPYAYGWCWQPIGAGSVEFNPNLITISKGVSDLGPPKGSAASAYGSSGAVNFSENTGTGLDIPDYQDGSTGAFLDVTDKYVFCYFGDLGGSLCLSYVGSSGLTHWQIIGDARGGQQNIAGIDFGVTYNGTPLTLIGARTFDSTASGYTPGIHIADYCELVFQVPLDGSL